VSLVIFRRFCNAKSKGGQIGPSHQKIFEKIEVKCIKKGDFGQIHYAIMAKVTFF